jgi:pilus assembly protein CpaF
MTDPSPLVEIERQVQAGAKGRVLDVEGTAGRRALRGMIDEAIAAWRSDFQRGRRPFDLLNGPALADRAFRNLAGYGPLEPLLG